ncbi:MAG: hypothetical protein AB7I42_12340 [Bradyrhizobium sp.]|uniref:hypothetical protein n=1 Tax=Bradyrhizobium sp. TaxID=376 RepID=UPI002A2FA85C|nr:hypothetical protein [Bradyrhizobium sp.]
MVGFPLLLIPLAVYNIVVLLMRDVSLSDPLLRLPLMSGAEWSISLGDMLLALAAIMLLLEIVKGARPWAKYLMDHLLSLIVFGAAAAEFLLLPKFGTSIFFLLTLFALVDFLAGVTLRRRRYWVAAEPAPAPRRATRQAEPQAEPDVVEPPRAPAPAPEVPSPAPPPSAASVAESVLLDRPEPSFAQPGVPSPGIQPGSGTHSPDTPSR